MDEPNLLDEQVPEHRLASADSDYVSGATCFMDGGLMMKPGPGSLIGTDGPAHGRGRLAPNPIAEGGSARRLLSAKAEVPGAAAPGAQQRKQARLRTRLPESRLRQPQEVHSRPGWAEAEPSVDLLCPRGVVGRYPKVSDVTGSLDRVTRQRRAAPAATGIGMDVHLGDLGTFARGLRIAASYCWRSKWKSLLQEDVRLCRRDRARGRA